MSVFHLIMYGSNSINSRSLALYALPARAFLLRGHCHRAHAHTGDRDS